MDIYFDREKITTNNFRRIRVVQQISVTPEKCKTKELTQLRVKRNRMLSIFFPESKIYSLK
tara:strand:+ start:12833 stop:13015 length:183 start_codon:yes stop_codon:yes gene_type:complete